MSENTLKTIKYIHIRRSKTEDPFIPSYILYPAEYTRPITLIQGLRRR